MNDLKNFTTTQAAAAKHGITLQVLDPFAGSGNTAFIVSRSAMSRTVASLDEARQLITRMTGGKP